MFAFRCATAVEKEWSHGFTRDPIPFSFPTLPPSGPVQRVGMSASVGLSPAYRASSVTTLPAFFSLHFFLVFLLWTLSVHCMHLFGPSHKFLACLNLPNFQHLCVRFSALSANFECAGVCSCLWQYCYFAAFSFLFCRCIYFLPDCIASILFLLLTNNSNLFCKMLEA